MALYCYMIKEEDYDYTEVHILGHENKYSPEEFDNICIEITEKHGEVEEKEYFSSYDLTNVKAIKYNVNTDELIEHLVNEYGFIKLDIPVSDGYYHKEISRTPVPPENLRKVVVKPLECPFLEGKSAKDSDERLFKENEPFTCSHVDSDYDVPEIMHFHARCKPVIKRKDEQ